MALADRSVTVRTPPLPSMSRASDCHKRLPLHGRQGNPAALDMLVFLASAAPRQKNKTVLTSSGKCASWGPIPQTVAWTHRLYTAQEQKGSEGTDGWWGQCTSTGSGPRTRKCPPLRTHSRLPPPQGHVLTLFL